MDTIKISFYNFLKGFANSQARWLHSTVLPHTPAECQARARAARRLRLYLPLNLGLNCNLSPRTQEV